MSAQAARLSSPVPPPLPPGLVGNPGPSPGESALQPCANCETPLRGPFCSQCGQHVGDLHRSVWRFVVDFFDNVFGWDNKVFRTLKPLLARPGTLTLDYLAGRRARYVHPLRLFLFTSAICLAVIQYFGSNPTRLHGGKSAGKKHHSVDVGLQINDPSPSPSADSDDDDDDTPAPAASAAPTPAEPTASGAGNERAAKPDTNLADALTLAAIKIRQASAAGSPAAAPVGSAASAPSGKEIGDQIARGLEIARQAEAAAKAGGGTEPMKEMAGGDQRRVSWVALALLPIFAVMLRSLYWRLEGYYFAHFVFSLHYHTFLLLFFVAYTLLHAVLPTSFGLVDGLLRLCLLLPGVYLFMALRRLYGESLRRTFAKVLLLGAMHVTVLALGLNIVHASSAFAV